MISTESNNILNVATREDEKLNASQAVRESNILGIIYGKEIKENIPVVFPKLNFMKVLSETGEGTLIKLQVGKEKGPRDVILQDIQYHVFTGDVIHVDFMAVSLEEEVEVEVPLDFVGVSSAVKDLGGIFVQNAENVEVRCKAKDIPKSIPVDISVLATFEDMIHLKDIALPANIELLDNPDNVIAMVDEPRSEQEMEELETEAAEDVTQVEGVKKEEEGAEGEEGVEVKAEGVEAKPEKQEGEDKESQDK